MTEHPWHGHRIEFTPAEETTVLCALVFYAMHIADPRLCITALQKVWPNPKRPWEEIISEGRERWALLSPEKS